MELWLVFFAGMFSLTAPRVDILAVALPANFIPILATLTIYFLPKNQFKAFITSLIGVWTHSVGLIIFIPLFLVDGTQKNWKYILLLLSVLFWGWYFISFSGQSGVIKSAYPPFYIIPTIQIFSLILIGLFGSIGPYFLYKMDNKRFKLIIAYIVIVMVSGYTDISRGFEYAALPLAIMAGLAVSKLYEIIKIKKKFLSNYFVLILVLLSILGVAPFFSIVENTHANWDNIPINGYVELSDYITDNSDQSEIIWADPSSADKIVWLTGRRVSNGRYSAPKNFVEEHQKINIYTINNTFYINNENNETIKKIDSKYVLFC